MPDSATSTQGSRAGDWDRNTWLVLYDLARNHPESGIHFQSRQSEMTKMEVITLI